MKLYDIQVKDQKGEMVSLKEYEGKVLLIVNTATQCGLTPQYEGLRKIDETFKKDAFEILDFPSNQFLEQAPESSDEIQKMCTMNFGIEYIQMGKVDVNGENESELYTFLKEKQPVDQANEATEGFLEKLKSLGQERPGSDIKWNFTKFLVNKEGEVVKRYSPTITPEEIEEDIRELL